MKICIDVVKLVVGCIEEGFVKQRPSHVAGCMIVFLIAP